MDKMLINRTVGTAIVRAGETGTAVGRRVVDGVNAVNWNQLVPEARRILDVGAKLALARQGLRVAASTTRRHPVATAIGAAALAGIGVAVWLTRRRAAVIEAEPTKKAAPRKRATAKKTAARKTTSKTARKAPAKKAASKRAAAKRAPAEAKSVNGSGASANA